jgi:transcriptional regulator with XRE-family HTH domain
MAKKVKNDNKSKKLAEKLRMLRLKKNMTQKELGDALEISAQSISGYENGSVMPDISFLYRCAAYFDVSMPELFDIHEVDRKLSDDTPTSSEMQMIQAYRRRPEWEKKAIRSLCFNGTAYRSAEEERRELENYLNAAEKNSAGEIKKK